MVGIVVPLVRKAPAARRPLAFELLLVRRKGRVADLLLLGAFVRFRQTVLAAKVQATVRALPHNLDRRVAALLLGASTVLAALLRAATQAEDEVQGRLLLDIIVAERPPIFELLARKDQALLVRGNALLVLDLGLDCRLASLGGEGVTYHSRSCHCSRPRA